MPPNEMINVEMIVARCELIKVDESIRQPLVISPNPQNMADIREPFIPILFKELINIENKWLVVITSSSTKVKHITPPIKSIEFTDDIMLCEKSKFCC